MQRLSIMSGAPTEFPIAEGAGVFVGIVAWDLLSDGRMEILKALIVAAACALVWYGARCWREKRNGKPH